MVMIICPLCPPVAVVFCVNETTYLEHLEL